MADSEAQRAELYRSGGIDAAPALIINAGGGLVCCACHTGRKANGTSVRWAAIECQYDFRLDLFLCVRCGGRVGFTFKPDTQGWTDREWAARGVFARGLYLEQGSYLNHLRDDQ